MFLVAHLSDLHLDGSPRTHERLLAVGRALAALKRAPDLIVVTGDLVEGKGEPGAEYAFLRNVLDSGTPTFFCPGNHDDRAVFRRELLPDRSAAPHAPINQKAKVGAATLLLLDSSVPGEDYGTLTPETLLWLSHQLLALPSGEPVLIALHHPPIAILHPSIDAIGLRDPERLVAVLRRYPHTAALLCGHTHTASATELASTWPVRVAPGISSSLRFPWETGDARPLVWDELAPPGLAFHVFDDQWCCTTHFRTVEESPPYSASSTKAAES